MNYSKKIISGLTVLLVLCVVAIIICACFRTDLVTMLIFVAVATVINIIGWGVLRIYEKMFISDYVAPRNKKSYGVRYDLMNGCGEYLVDCNGEAFFVIKSYYDEEDKFLCAFIVRTFPFDNNDEKSVVKARLNAYSLLNHITSNGSLWPTSKNQPETEA